MNKNVFNEFVAMLEPNHTSNAERRNITSTSSIASSQT